MKWLLILLMTACTTANKSGHQAFVEHYVGEVEVFLPNAKKAIGKIPTVVRRTVDPDAGEMMEEVVQPGRTPQMPAKEIVTNFVSTAHPGLFKVHDTGRSFKGLVQFEGTPWGWEEWSYNIKLKDGSTLTGTGRFEGRLMLTDKKMTDKSGKLMFHIREKLQEVDATIYKERRLLIVKKKKATKPQ